MLAVRADLDAVGRAHAGGEASGFPIAVNAPELAGALLPVWVAREERAVRCDGEVVGLVHLRLVSEDGNLFRLHVHAQDVVLGVIRDEHGAGAVEDDAVAGALVGKGEEDFRASVRRGFADGLLSGEVDGVDVAVAVAAGAFDAGGELSGLGKRARSPERLDGAEGTTAGKCRRGGERDGEPLQERAGGHHAADASATYVGLAIIAVVVERG